MPSIKLYPGDNQQTLRALIDQGVQVHSCVTDPPYGLVSIQKRFGKQGYKAPRTEGNDGSFARLSGGFLGKKWDATEIERDPEFWKLIYDILLPGGFVFAFSGSRTGHWQAVAMEMAGFIMHPMHGWVYGSGFPKGHAIKVEGFEGWSHGTQTQKPALEPIYLAQKPFSEKTGDKNVAKHGVGAFNIDDCRIPYEDSPNPATNPLYRKNAGYANSNASDKGSSSYSMKDGSGERNPNNLGRYPSNLILDGSDDVVAMFPHGKSGKPGTRRKNATSVAMSGDLGMNGLQVGYGDEGSAARFFHHFPPDMNPVFYQPKATKADRAGGKHPTVKPIALMQYLIRHITPPGGIVLDPFAGSGTTGEAAKREGFDCILMEAETEYVDFLDSRFSNREDLVYTNEDSDDDIGLLLDDDTLVIDSDDLGNDIDLGGFDIEDIDTDLDLDISLDILDDEHSFDVELESEEDLISLDDV